MRVFRRMAAAVVAVLVVMVAAGWEARFHFPALQSVLAAKEPAPPSAGAPAALETNTAVNAPFVIGFGYVDIDGGAAPLSFPTMGVVEELLVGENDHVRAGQPLAVLRSVEAQAQIARVETAVEQARLRLAEARRVPPAHALQLQRQEQAIAGAAAKVAAHRRTIAKLEGLVESSTAAKESLLIAKDELRGSEAMHKAEQLALEQLRLVQPCETVRLAELGLAAAEAQCKLACEHLANHTLRAPQSGIVLRVLVVRGQTLGPNQTQPVLWFCPDQPRIVRCEINQRFARRIRQGVTARILDDVENTPLAQGKIQRCALWVSHRRSLLDEPFERNDVRTLECIVSVDLGGLPLRLGERVRVEIRTDGRSS